MEFITKALLENKGVLPLICPESLPQEQVVTAVAFLRAGGSAAQLSVRIIDYSLATEQGTRLENVTEHLTRILSSLQYTNERLRLGQHHTKGLGYLTYVLTRETL